MIEINTTAILLGGVIGLLISVLFFYGLHWGMRLALASTSPGGVLLLSFFVRMTLLLAVAFVLIRFTKNQRHGPRKTLRCNTVEPHT